jgi:hypothetical protein
MVRSPSMLEMDSFSIVWTESLVVVSRKFMMFVLRYD